LYLEASGTKLEIPDIREIEGFQIIGRQSNNHFEMGRGHQSITARRGYYLRALAPGDWTIPSFEIQVSGRRVKTDPIDLTVTDAPVAARPPAAPNPGPQRSDLPPKEDLVFIDMFVDKHEVYQGEPVLLTEQVWQLD